MSQNDTKQRTKAIHSLQGPWKENNVGTEHRDFHTLQGTDCSHDQDFMAQRILTEWKN